MRRALKVSGVGVQEMADYLGVSRASVGAWVNDRQAPKVQTLRLWAIRTGAPYEWLRTGKAKAPRPSDGGGAMGVSNLYKNAGQVLQLGRAAGYRKAAA
jgi:transcriptional regulator with XRE-family HTH domain